MTDSLTVWLSEHARFPGLLGWGLRRPDDTACAHSFSPGFPVAAIEGVCHIVADTFLLLHLNRLPTGRVRWVFEKASLHCARRREGTYLAVLIARDSETTNADALERFLTEFKTLKTQNQTRTGE
jgi:hypothetical protein